MISRMKPDPLSTASGVMAAVRRLPRSPARGGWRW
ncbi:hypothetical protein BCL64_103317 [Halomonas ventosae]|uniref:Uncharacterized protein n=1 Tax=Halomonas ventosae TaxID=229007 RepID=A0A2T0VQT5_9GAMM|nr:hypothetical protein BCL64_103317 [Halomonas ventosae]